MEVQLDKRYPIDAPLDAAWAVLSDLHATAACMPGAQITESVDATHHKGTVRAKVGPATLSFQGEIEQQGQDAAAHRIALHAKGADRAGSSAAMQLQAHLEPGDDDDECVLVGQATVTVGGKLAQFGNRLLMPASDAILAQFAHQFRLAARRHAGLDAGGEGAAAGESTEVRMVQGAQAMGTLDAPPVPATTRADTVAVRLAPRAAMAPARPAAPPPPPALNLGAVLWAALKGWFSGLFGRRR